MKNYHFVIASLIITTVLYLHPGFIIKGENGAVWGMHKNHSKRTKTNRLAARTSRKGQASEVRTSARAKYSHSRQLAWHEQSESIRKKHRHVAPKPRYAYPMSIFLYEPPAFDQTPLPEEECLKIKRAFNQGTADEYSTRSLVKARLVTYYPIRGGIFFRREPIKNIIMHSTEPGIPVGAKTIIDGWSHGGRRHPGAHYVVDRDGIIYQALDPDLAAVHINIFKTLPGFNNDNSVGIEMCHQGSQNYTYEQIQSVIKLVVYLQNHYHVPDRNIVTHRYAQQGDHTDPVNFAWNDFIADKIGLQNQSLKARLAELKTEALAWQPVEQAKPLQPQIYKGNKALVVDFSKSNNGAKPNDKVSAIEPQIPVTTSDEDKTISDFKSAPVPVSSHIDMAPVTPTSVSRLVPASTANRLIPAPVGTTRKSEIESDIINNNSYSQLDSASTASVSSPAQTKKILPLRGPIEMDLDDAAGLLNEDTANK